MIKKSKNKEHLEQMELDLEKYGHLSSATCIENLTQVLNSYF